MKIILFNEQGERLNFTTRTENNALIIQVGAPVLDRDTHKKVDSVLEIKDYPKDYYKFFSIESPCWFEGCDELRKQYLEEKKVLDESDCPSCKRGALNRKYLNLIHDKLKS